MYSVTKAQIVGHVRHIIPFINAALDNRQAYHHISIIEMEGKLCDQVVSILIDPRYDYGYVSLHLVDKCGLNRQVHR